MGTCRRPQSTCSTSVLCVCIAYLHSYTITHYQILCNKKIDSAALFFNSNFSPIPLFSPFSYASVLQNTSIRKRQWDVCFHMKEFYRLSFFSDYFQERFTQRCYFF